MLNKPLSHLLLWTMVIFMVMAFTHLSSAVEMRVEDASGAPGEDVTIAVLIDDEGDTLSADFTIGYDREILTATGAENTSLTSVFIVAHTIKWEQVTVALGGDTALTSGKGAVVNVTFSISEDAKEGETTITISDVTLYDSTYQTKAVTTVDGKLIISTTPVTTTAGPTTTIEDQPCPSEAVYGEHSEKTEILRYLRDNVLSKTPEGQEIIRLYYGWSPAIVKTMEKDGEFKEYVKEIVDGVLELIE